jgi:tripartite-type tricarboxylate transporter receptor subunit TctC
MLTRRDLVALSAASAVTPALVGRTASAQTAAAGWPSHTVRMIVPLAPGGPTDAVGRIMAEQLSQKWRQQVIVENKPGGGTNIANEYVAHSEPDGYTALYGTSSLAVNATLYRRLKYDPMIDLAPVSLVARFPFFMFVPNSSPAKTVAEFIALAKSRPGKMVMASPGTGSAPHLAEALFLQMAQIQMTHAPYRGAGPAFIDLIPGRVDCYFGSGELLNYSRSGQVRALATTGDKRTPAEPDLPTIAESGVAGYEVDSWQGVFAPAKTPPEIIKKMNGDIVSILTNPAVQTKLAGSGYAAQSSSPDELRSLLKEDTAKWSGVIKTAGIKLD